METKGTRIHELIKEMTIEEKVSQLTNSAAAIAELLFGEYSPSGKLPLRFILQPIIHLTSTIIQ